MSAQASLSNNTAATRRFFPFNAEQTLNIASEMGPIFTMFIVNFIWGVDAGVISLIVATIVALAASLIVLRAASDDAVHSGRCFYRLRRSGLLYG